MQRNWHASLAASAGLLAVTAGAALLRAQQDPPNPAAATSPSTASPPEQPLIVVTENQRRLRIVPLARGLSHPWGMALLPDGRTLLVTERPGRLRIVRDGVLDPAPVAGGPTVNPTFIGGLNDVALHPAFASNQLVYLSYAKDGERGVTLAVARVVSMADPSSICAISSSPKPGRPEAGRPAAAGRSAAASSSAPTACCT